MELQTLFLVLVVVGVLGFVVTRRILRHLTLKRLDWKWVKQPDLRITIGLNHPPFGLGLDRRVKDQMVGRSHDGTPFQAFRYSSESWSDRCRESHFWKSSVNFLSNSFTHLQE